MTAKTRPAGARKGSHRSRARAAVASRDAQTATAFAAILSALIGRVPGARGAALVDGEGETVDYAGVLDPFDLRVAGAYLQLLLRGVASGALGAARSIAIRGTKTSFLAYALADDYAVVVALGRRAGMSGHARALASCERALAREAGWPIRASLASWHSVDVGCDARGRPINVRIADGASAPAAARDLHDFQVIGAIAGTVRERGYRVRLGSGFELTLVREPGGHWYADENPDTKDPTEPREKSRSSAPPKREKKKR